MSSKGAGAGPSGRSGAAEPALAMSDLAFWKRQARLVHCCFEELPFSFHPPRLSIQLDDSAFDGAVERTGGDRIGRARHVEPASMPPVTRHRVPVTAISAPRFGQTS
jgi:hypothetical protein